MVSTRTLRVACVLLAFIALLSCFLSTISVSWLHYFYMVKDNGVMKRAEGDLHDYWRDVGLTQMRQTPCKDEKTIPDLNDKRYGDVACSLSQGTETYFLNWAWDLQYESTSTASGDIIFVTDEEKSCYHEADTKDFAQRLHLFSRALKTSSVFAYLSSLMYAIICGTSIARVLRGGKSKESPRLIVVLFSVIMVFSILVLILTSSTCPTANYKVCEQAGGTTSITKFEFENVFQLSYAWVFYCFSTVICGCGLVLHSWEWMKLRHHAKASSLDGDDDHLIPRS